MKQHLLFVLLAILVPQTVFAQGEGSLWWGFHHGTYIPDTQLGVSKATTYETAIHLDGVASPLQGSVIQSVRLPFIDVTHITDVTLWFTTELGQQDVAAIPVTDLVAGWNVVRLTEPVAIPEGGLYVGYTFTVTELDGQSERPLVMCEDNSEGGFWLRVAEVRAYAKWTTTKRYGSLAMQLELTNPSFSAASVAVETISSDNMVMQTENHLKAVVTNYGTAMVNSLDYTYIIGGETRTGTCLLPEPLATVYGAKTSVTLPVTAPSATGRLEAVVRVDAANGISNQQAQSQATTSLLCLQFKPHHRTVMEEYTGTWCSMCPRGFAGIARLKQMFPDDFIAASVHVLNGDPMDVYYDYYYVIGTTQFPSCRFDRHEVTDPYDGDYPDGYFHADQNFLAANRILSPANLHVEAEWNADDVCNITSTADFAFDAENCDYTMVYLMTEDGLRGPEGDHAWHQKNSFPQLPYYVEDDMQQYVNATGSMIDDIAYNDVVIAMSDVRGIEGSLDGSQQVGISKTHSFQLSRPAISQNKENIHVIALLIDKRTGLVANAAVTPVTTPAGVEAVRADGNTADRYYSLDGRILTVPQSGINIVRRADGTIRKILK